LWVFTTKGFFSIVEHKKDPNRVVIRARIRKDIDSIKMLFEELGFEVSDVEENVSFDYRYRVFASRSDWASVMIQLITDMGYTNFKNAVHEADAPEIKDKRHEVYLDIWAIMHELQFSEG
jgi:hypothetical protein